MKMVKLKGVEIIKKLLYWVMANGIILRLKSLFERRL